MKLLLLSLALLGHSLVSSQASSCNCIFGKCTLVDQNGSREVPSCPWGRKREAAEEIIENAEAVEKREADVYERLPDDYREALPFIPWPNCSCYSCYGSHCSRVQNCTEQRVYKRENAEEVDYPIGHCDCSSCVNGRCTHGMKQCLTRGKREVSEEIVENGETVEKRETAEEGDTNYAGSCNCILGECTLVDHNGRRKVPSCPGGKKREVDEEIVENKEAVEKREAAEEEDLFPYLGNCSCTSCYGRHCSPVDNCTRIRYATLFVPRIGHCECVSCFGLKCKRGLKECPVYGRKREVAEEIDEKIVAVEKREAAEEGDSNYAGSCNCILGECTLVDHNGRRKVPSCPGGKKREVSEEIVENGEAVEKREVIKCATPSNRCHCRKDGTCLQCNGCICRKVPSCPSDYNGVRPVTTVAPPERIGASCTCVLPRIGCKYCDVQTGCKLVPSCSGKREAVQEPAAMP